VCSYFLAWTEALALALQRAGHGRAQAAELAEDVLAGIQGALVLARAADNSKLFGRALTRLRKRVAR
jgi:pyrroline-5-carboxylate reductase